MAGREKYNSEQKHKEKQPLITGRAQTAYGKGTAFLIKLEAVLSIKYTGKENLYIYKAAV